MVVIKRNHSKQYIFQLKWTLKVKVKVKVKKNKKNNNNNNYVMSL